MKIFLLLLVLTTVSCYRKPADDHKKMELLANRTCRAISIRQQRFALANQMRFAQDTLFKTKNKNDSARLKKELEKFSKQKNILLKESLALADTIRRQLDTIMPFTDKPAQKRFTAELDSLLAKKGCMATRNNVK